VILDSFDPLREFGSLSCAFVANNAGASGSGNISRLPYPRPSPTIVVRDVSWPRSGVIHRRRDFVDDAQARASTVREIGSLATTGSMAFQLFAAPDVASRVNCHIGDHRDAAALELVDDLAGVGIVETTRRARSRLPTLRVRCRPFLERVSSLRAWWSG